MIVEVNGCTLRREVVLDEVGPSQDDFRHLDDKVCCSEQLASGLELSWSKARSQALLSSFSRSPMWM